MIRPETLENLLKKAQEKAHRLPDAFFITSPDYLGKPADIRALAGICHRYDMPLFVDNAHGAYLHFLREPQHPMDLGADLCCDSAHKTLPALTGAADVVKFIILIACLALAAFAVVAMVVGCFKIRFFRRLARVLLVIETLGMAGLILIAVNTTNTGAFPENLVAALKEGSPLVFDLIQGIFADFGVKTVPSVIIILVLFFVIWAILHLIIFFSRKIMKRKDVADADAPDALPEEELLEEAPAHAPAAAPAEAVASVPVEEPIVPADVPEQEIETVTEADAADRRGARRRAG